MTSRRQFFRMLGAGLLATPVAAAGIKPAPPEFVSTSETPSLKGKVRVLLDGDDVTADCFEAQATRQRPDGRTRYGRVRCWKRLPDGRRYMWGSPHDPDPTTNRPEWHQTCKHYHIVDGKAAWRKPYPGFGEIAWDEFSGDVSIEWL